MKTITIKLYQFEELSEEAKEKAIEDYRDKMSGDNYFWDEDALKSLKKFAEHFGAELKNYGIDFFGGSPSYVKFGLPYEEPLPFLILKALIIRMGAYDKKTLRGLGECKFTGYTADEDAADGARQSFLKGERDLNEILQAGFRTWLKAAQQDAEHQQSAEYAEEEIVNNEYTFEEDGTMYK